MQSQAHLQWRVSTLRLILPWHIHSWWICTAAARVRWFPFLSFPLIPGFAAWKWHLVAASLFGDDLSWQEASKWGESSHGCRQNCSFWTSCLSIAVLVSVTTLMCLINIPLSSTHHQAAVVLFINTCKNKSKPCQLRSGWVLFWAFRKAMPLSLHF